MITFFNTIAHCYYVRLQIFLCFLNYLSGDVNRKMTNKSIFSTSKQPLVICKPDIKTQTFNSTPVLPEFLITRYRIFLITLIWSLTYTGYVHNIILSLSLLLHVFLRCVHTLYTTLLLLCMLLILMCSLSDTTTYKISNNRNE